MNIILIRHGETEDNVDKIFSRKDTRLTKNGQKQIENTKTLLKNIKDLDRYDIYVSPLIRAKETLEILDLQAIEDKRIREIDFGDFEGLTYEEIKKTYPLESKLWIEDFINYAPPKGESIHGVYKRLVDFLEDLVEKGQDAVLVCHDGVIRLSFSWVFNNADYFLNFKTDNGSINIINVTEEGKIINRANYTK